MVFVVHICCTISEQNWFTLIVACDFSVNDISKQLEGIAANQLEGNAAISKRIDGIASYLSPLQSSDTVTLAGVDPALNERLVNIEGQVKFLTCR